MRIPLAVLLLTGVAACHTPTPNDLVLLDVPGRQRFALSTEDGVLALSADDLATREVPAIQYWKARETRDDLMPVQRTDDLVLLKPATARFTSSTFAAEDIEPGETLYIQLIADDFERLPYVVEACWYDDGRYGDLLALEGWFVDSEDIAARFANAGVYVKRKGVYEIVGLLQGTLCSNPNTGFLEPAVLLPFMRLDAIAPVLPVTSNFFQRGPRVFRPDFEHGLESDGRERKRANR